MVNIVGSIHGTDVPYTFGFPLLHFNEDVKDNAGIITPIDHDETDVAVSEFMMTCWTNFAKYG